METESKTPAVQEGVADRLSRLVDVAETLPKLLTVREAAELSRLSKSKIYQLFDQGVLRRLRLPSCNKVLICEEELKQYIKAGIDAGLAAVSA